MPTKFGLPSRPAALALCTLACTSAWNAAAAATLRVPQDVATIQGAIASAQPGDTVTVSPGTYPENLDFLGKAITVQSAKGPKVTIIDGGQRDSVVIFHLSEGRDSVLKGFTLRNGNAAQYPDNGGGINIDQASPTIEGNWVTGSSACSGNGIGLYFSGALIKNNRVYGNHQNGCGGGTLGGGIYIGGTGNAQVIDNLIEDNQTDLAGGGIGLDASGVVQIARNIVRHNTAGNWGGGIGMLNSSSPTFTDNLVFGNSAGQGGGLFFLMPDDAAPLFVNNTFADNLGTQAGSEVYASGLGEHVQFINDIFRGSQGSSTIYCDGSYDQTPPTFTTNDVFTTSGVLIQGTCTNLLATGGNVSVDPKFAAEGKSAHAYALRSDSAAIDAGTPTSIAGRRDVTRQLRVVDGNGDGTAIIDLGAEEYSPQ